MFWKIKNSRFSSGAFALFNSAFNHNSSGNCYGQKAIGTSKNVGKKSGYNKLACCEDTSATTAADISNGNVKTNLKTPLTSTKNGESTDSSSASEFELEEDEFTDDSEYDESLTCNVCDRSFCSPRALSQHQQKKRHFGCSACDSLFPSLMALEHHKEEFEHWSADENILVPNSQSEESSEETSEEMERLL